MKSNTTSRTTGVNNPALGFQRLKGFYILDYNCVMTRHQVVDVLGQYLLVEFEDGGLIRHRTVSFWHSILKDGYLKIIVYDINNKVIITKLFNIETEDTDWFLIEKDIFKDEILEFEHHDSFNPKT